MSKKALLLFFIPVFAFAGDAPVSPWDIAAGAAVVTAPKYPGSKGTRIAGFPFWDIEYKKRIYSKGLDFIGVRWIQTPAFSATTALRYDFRQRKENIEDRLFGLGDISETLRAKGSLDYSFSLYQLGLSAAQDVGRNDEGLLVSADARMVIPFIPKWFFTGGPGVTWANQEYNKTFYGVSAAQSRTSRFPAFRTRPGISDVHANVLVSRTLTPRWSMTAIYFVQWLQDSALASPITQVATQHTGVLTFSYSFLTSEPIQNP